MLKENKKTKVIRSKNCEFEVDAGIEKTIYLLNKKGYSTEFCCNGHEEDLFRSWYIKFSKHLEKSKKEFLKHLASKVRYLKVELQFEAVIYYHKLGTLISCGSSDMAVIQVTDLSLLTDEAIKEYLNTDKIYKSDIRETITFSSTLYDDYSDFFKKQFRANFGVEFDNYTSDCLNLQSQINFYETVNKQYKELYMERNAKIIETLNSELCNLLKDLPDELNDDEIEIVSS